MLTAVAALVAINAHNFQPSIDRVEALASLASMPSPEAIQYMLYDRRGICEDRRFIWEMCMIKTGNNVLICGEEPDC